MANLQVGSPLTLKCGLTLPNRLVKAAMAEKMAEAKAMPGQQFKSTYGEWADGSWGMVLTGNVQVDQRYLGNAHDVAYNDDVAHDQMLQTWKAWASVCSRSGTPTLVQINHPGRQSPAGAGTRGLLAKNVTPSAVAMDFGSGWAARLISALAFGTPRAMTSSDIDDVVRRFAATARLAAEAGFAGVEIHAAHGYLLAQFLSSKTNRRTDAYGGSPAARAQIVLDVIRAVRAAVPDRFCIGIKLNSVEQQSADALRDCIEQLQLIAAAGVDFLEISGGTYEDPQMMLGIDGEMVDLKSDRTRKREAFFLEFAQTIRAHLPDIPLMVTGGFRTRAGMEAALTSGGCDLVGIGRPAVLNPGLPANTILNPEIKDADSKVYARRIESSWLARALRIRAVGGGAEDLWYGARIRKMGRI